MGQKSLPTTPNIQNTTPNIHSAETEKLFRDLTAGGVEFPRLKKPLMVCVYMCVGAYTCECACVCVVSKFAQRGEGSSRCLFLLPSTYFLRQTLSLNLELTYSASLTSQ